MNEEMYELDRAVMSSERIDTSPVDEAKALAEKVKRYKRNKSRRERDQLMRDLGLVKVKGNLGGTYWE